MSRILLVDDEAAARLVLQNRLKDLGHQVVAVENGAKGLLEVREGGFDLILIEVALGSGISGIEVCRRLKQIPQSAHTPVVMLARSATSKDEVHQAYDAGCDGFLQKSEMVLFEDVLRATLRTKSVQDELARQIRALDAELRRRQEERQQDVDRGTAGSGEGEQSLLQRELASGRPDGVLLVDADGIVRYADRGARDLLGGNIEGKNLGRLAPNTGFEAFVRDAHTEPRDGFRFDLKAAGTRPARSLSASVVPLSANQGEKDPGLRIVILLDAGKRRVASELLRLQEYSIPRREVGVLLDAARRAFGADSLIGNSQAMRAVRALVAAIAGISDPVLIAGEPGTGKLHLARALHFNGSFTGPFLPLSCAALSPQNLESELFGQARGAGAEAGGDHPGLLQQAHHGTVYLEEIEHLPIELQRKLVRALRDGEVRRVGTERVERIEARVIASSTLPLANLSALHDFDAALRELFARNAIELPPLRDRREDIPALSQHFLERFGSAKSDLELADEALWVLENYTWPGNVRELATAVERAVAAAERGVIELEHFPPSLRELSSKLPTRDLVPNPRPERIAIGGAPGTVAAPNASVLRPQPTQPRAQQPWDIAEDEPVSLDLYEKKALLRALHETGGDKLAAARLLKVGKSTLYRKLKRFGIS